MPTILRCKVLVVGNAAVGKSAMTSVFHTEGASFPKNYGMTIGGEFIVKQVPVPSSASSSGSQSLFDEPAVQQSAQQKQQQQQTSVEMYVFDLAGQEIYRDLVKQYMVGANMVVFVYDPTNPDSFRDLPQWIEMVTPFLPRGEVRGALVSTKGDLEARAVVKQQDGMAFAKHHNLKFFSVSTKENKGIDSVFSSLAADYYSLFDEAIKSFLH